MFTGQNTWLSKAPCQRLQARLILHKSDQYNIDQGFLLRLDLFYETLKAIPDLILRPPNVAIYQDFRLSP